MQIFLKLARRNEKPVFVSNEQDFLSVWSVSHAWENLPPESTAAIDIPTSIQVHVDSLLLAFMRDEISLRRSYGYRVVGHTALQVLFGMDKDFQQISDQLYRKKPLDKSLLDDLYVRRSELLRWCEGEYRAPPACWAPERLKVDDRESEEDADETDGDSWLNQLTERRRKIVACLEMSKHLWQQNSKLSYEDVYNHPLLVQTGFRTNFSLESFKKWARSIASEDAKRGGRRAQSTA